MNRQTNKEDCMMSIYGYAQSLDNHGYQKLFYKILSRLADENHTPSLAALGCCFLDGYHVKKNKKMALSLYRRSSRLGDNLGTFNMALLYKDDLKQYKKALYWFRTLKEIDFYRHEIQLEEAKMYMEGLGVKKNSKIAKALLLDILENSNRLSISQAGYEEVKELLLSIDKDS